MATQLTGERVNAASGEPVYVDHRALTKRDLSASTIREIKLQARRTLVDEVLSGRIPWACEPAARPGPYTTQATGPGPGPGPGPCIHIHIHINLLIHVHSPMRLALKWS